MEHTVSLPLARQHLIDPEVCIRCNTCEAACPRDAITHDRSNYAVRFDVCNNCGDCLPPCPTGAIDSWRQVTVPWSVAEQFEWAALPPDQRPPPQLTQTAMPDDVERLTARATSTVGHVPPPWSAAHPYVGLYSAERPAVATVVGNFRLTSEESDSDIRHLVLDFGSVAFPVLEGQTLGVLVPGTDGAGRPHAVRLYSVASPRDGERPRHNNLALTVKRVTRDRDGAPAHGLASNYLCDLPLGAQVKVTGPWGTSFLMPNHPGSKLLMICTGTGAAPMRAMTERRRRRASLGEGGEILLFFGARGPSELPYHGPLMKLPRSLLDVELAFSRLADRPKEYVQDRLRARADDVFRLVRDPECFVYLCGHKRMEQGVDEAFESLCADRGVVWRELRDAMKREGRYHVETY